MNKILISFVLTALFLTACSASASVSIAGEWKLVSYGDPASPKPAASGIETSIAFDQDGKINGSVGCNGFGGEYKIKGNTIEFNQMVATMMFCEGPVGEQESALLTVFQETAAYSIEGNSLAITSADGSTIVVLRRK